MREVRKQNSIREPIYSAIDSDRFFFCAISCFMSDSAHESLLDKDLASRGACKSRSFIKTAITVLLTYEIGHGFLQSLFDFAKNEPEIDSPRWKDFVIH